MNTGDRSQTFFDYHTDDIISFYQNKSNKSIIYTGELGKKSLVYAWKVEDGE